MHRVDKKENDESRDRRITAKETISSIVDALGVPPLFAKILASRGIQSPEAAETFLFPKLERLSDPLDIPDIDRGVSRVVEAIKKREKICLYGDYDADGITSTALMVNFFRHLEIEPNVYIPRRKEGYGLNAHALKRIHREGATLIICLDCGSTNIEEVRHAGRLGMDVVIIDHHEVEEVLPSAVAIINPKRKDSRFPTRELAACGVTFFFLVALRRTVVSAGLSQHPINLKNELDLAAIGTVGDMVPLVGDNRLIVKYGIEVMRKKPRTWVKSFIRQNMVRKGGVNEFVLNFIVIPRINATGRIGEPKNSLDFLTCNDPRGSDDFLHKLHDANRERQRIEGETLRQTVEMIKRDNLDSKGSIVLFKEDWHIGVIGVVAQRLVEMFGKPTIVFTEVDGLCKGSGRGGDGIDLHETIRSLAPLLVKFGGHRYACGVSMEREKIPYFREAFEESIKRGLSKRIKKVGFDAVADFDELNGDLLEWIEHLSPFGVGNPRPTLLMSPSKVQATNRFVKIIDEKNRIWHGSYNGKPAIPSKGPAGIVVSPVMKEESGERFVHLFVKDFFQPAQKPENGEDV